MSLTPPTGLAPFTTIVTGPFSVFWLLSPPELAITNPTTATTTAAATTPKRARCDIRYLHRLDEPAGRVARDRPLRDGGERRGPGAELTSDEPTAASVAGRQCREREQRARGAHTKRRLRGQLYGAIRGP